MADNHHCQACNELDQEPMVACDKCDSWWHFECVGVGDSVSEKEFICPKCSGNTEKENPTTEPMKSADTNAGGSTTGKHSNTNLRLQMLEEQKVLMARKLEMERAEQRRQHEVERLLKDTEIEKKQLEMEIDFLEEKFRVLEQDGDDDGDDVMSRASAQSSISKVNRWREQLLGGVVNSTMAIQETVPIPVTSSTTAVNVSPQTTIQSNAEGIPTTSGNGPVLATLTEVAAHNSNNEGVNRQHQPMRAVTVPEGRIPVPVPIRTVGLPNSTARQKQPSNLPVCNDNTRPIGGVINEIPPQGQLFNAKIGGETNRRRYDTSNIMSHDYVLGRQVLAGTNGLQGNVPSSQAGIQEFGSRYYFSPTQNHSFLQGAPNQYSFPPGPSGNSLPQSYPPSNSYLSRTNPSMLRVGPTPEQLAARQVLPKELPPFSGNPEDWPLFISSFNNSNDACGFTHAENLMRLQRCLRGPALDAVRSRLLLPNSVPQVISTLQTLYGRPEILVYALLKKVREVPAPKSERLETLIGFGMAVQNLCDHLQAGEQEAHLNNPTLLFELVDKLPSNLKLDWAMVKRQQPGANLRTFASYMSTIVSAATEVTLTVDTKIPHHRMKEKNYCNSHSAEATTSDSHPKPVDNSFGIKQCLICKDSQHRVKSCDSFKKLTVDERWKLVQKLSLCRICLFSHGRRPCRSKERC
ncbi:uncharacterized protein LOC129773970 [Toxorhynchites rutilus septentrionalis]|uniref:uncharacterized protein LOC129773970 n=1 Tax=Toxorhynchites rutilus septentrionalis TaxID=329112 RepID=UPI002479F8AE|nr:uncharacterized protein LOC129773970 [Toxorhynchites rutilus septentrionalis]